MKITVITGSPRKNGNSFATTKAFIDEAERLGHSVMRFDAAFMKIGGCHDCQTCYRTGKACSFDDDFNIIAPHILDSDAVVFTMPTYWYSIPAQIKGVIDRMFSFVVGGKKTREKMRVDRLLRGKRSFRNGRRTHSDRAFRGAIEMGSIRGSVIARSARSGRYRQNRWS